MFTDHKPLIQAFAKQADPWSPRQQRHLSYISEFSTDIQHVAGQSNVVADRLSRPSASAVTFAHEGLNLQQLALAQADDTEFSAAANSSLRLELVNFTPKLQLWCDTPANLPEAIPAIELAQTCVWCATLFIASIHPQYQEDGFYKVRLAGTCQRCHEMGPYLPPLPISQSATPHRSPASAVWSAWPPFPTYPRGHRRTAAKVQR